MAVKPIKKAFVFTYPEHRDELLKALQRSGLIHLASAEAVLPEEATAFFSPTVSKEIETQIRQTEKRLSSLQWLIDEAEKREQPGSLLERFMKMKELTTPEDFETLHQYDETPLLKEFREVENHIHELEKLIRHNRLRVRQLTPLAFHPMPLEAFAGTQSTFFSLIITEARDGDLSAPLETLLGEESEVRLFLKNKDQGYWLVIGRREKEAEYRKWLEDQSLKELRFDGMSGTPADNIHRLESEIRQAEAHIGEMEKQLEKHVVHLPMLHKVYDYWANELERLRAAGQLRHSQYTALVSGWITGEDVSKLEAHLSQTGFPADALYLDAAPGDNPPVVYENPPLVKPFEYVTDLYSRPRYGEIDPTPFLSAFFALFFGICLTDAGYGLVLIAVTLLALKKLKGLTENSRKLVRILFYSGILTTGVGFFTGGFFGLTFDQLPDGLSALQHVVLLNPLTNQMGFLIFALALGILHVSFGIFLKFRWSLKQGETAEAWLDQAPWLMILLGVVALSVAGWLSAGWLSTTGYVLLGVAAVVILLFAGRTSKNPLVRFARGIFSLYQVSGLLGDILSYARLFALGLATGVIAGVVNFLAQLTLGIPYLGYVLMPLVLIAGHLMNILINALGGFIHTTRLQFVEFFGKFYEGGGEPFTPFQLNLKYSAFREESEGGNKD